MCPVVNQGRSRCLVWVLATLLPTMIGSCADEYKPPPRGELGNLDNPFGGRVPGDDAGFLDTDSGTGPDGGLLPQDQCVYGEVAEPLTNRCWLRCPAGQTWTGAYCEGGIQTGNWQWAMAQCEMMIGGYYHAASRDEMIEILGNCDPDVANDAEGYCLPCATAGTCEAMFDFDGETHWTSTTGTPAPWVVSFLSGLVYQPSSPDELHTVRCLRELTGGR